MKDVLIIKSIFLFIIIWGLALVLVWVRARIEWIWKIAAALIFGFYIWFFFAEIELAFIAFKMQWYLSLLGFFKELFAMTFTNLFFFWPLALIIVFFKVDEMGAESLLKFMCILSLVLWIIFIAYYYLHTDIDKFFFETLKNLLPGTN
jgi:hypothetical protein